MGSNFMVAQRYNITANVIFQDNQITMLLANNGRQSSGKKTRHIDIRYFFITDNVKRGKASIAYCPTENMLADFFTKPFQGSLFWKFKSLIINLSDPVTVPQECVAENSTKSDFPEKTPQPSDHVNKPIADVKWNTGKLQQVSLLEQAW